uniref:Uncharacterized protein n=1 Tax=viral metagenome TaxID=1070528 RepID=A0A6M3KGM7_9ZZZZ
MSKIITCDKCGREVKEATKEKDPVTDRWFDLCDNCLKQYDLFWRNLEGIKNQRMHEWLTVKAKDAVS